MTVATVKEKFSIPDYLICQEVIVEVEKHDQGGELLLIRDSKKNPIALLKLVGEDAFYFGEPRIKIILPKDRYVKISGSLRSVLLTPAKIDEFAD